MNIYAKRNDVRALHEMVFSLTRKMMLCPADTNTKKTKSFDLVFFVGGEGGRFINEEELISPIGAGKNGSDIIPTP